MDNHVSLTTNKAVGERSGVGRSTVQRIRAREGSTTIDKIEAIASVFGVTAADLLAETKSANQEIERSAGFADEIIQLISLYQQANEMGRKFIMDSALGADKGLPARWTRIARAGD